METTRPAWYCSRTKPKHEHIAAAILLKNFNLEVFCPRLRVERATRRGLVRVNEPLFPCYIFIRCELADNISNIQHASGIIGLVRTGGRAAEVPDLIIEELKTCFVDEAPILVNNECLPGDEVGVVGGVFAQSRALVLRVMPARQRVLVLLDILGRPMPVELDAQSIVKERSLSELVPFLAAAGREQNPIFA
jgi:transcriptional antiterminator RfaH